MLKHLHRKLTALFLLIAPFCGIAQSVNRAKLDSLFDALASNNKAMLNIAISKNGEVIYKKAIGYSWYGAKNVEANTDTKYRIGSISKVFTAVMIFQLIEEGKLQLTTPLSKFYPQLPNAGKITIAQMLDHSSGIHSFTDDSSYSSWLGKKTTPAQLIAKMATGDFEPGTKHQYSNSNFVLLGYIVEKLDKKPYAAALKQRITGKIKLNNTYYGGKINATANEAYSYKWAGSWQPDTETDMSIPGGAGALVSTTTDLVTFMHALFNGKLVSEKSLTQMKTIHDGYGMNLFPYKFSTQTGYGHNGGIDGFQSQAVYYPDDNIAVSYLANGVNYSLNTMMVTTLSIIYNKPATIPDFKTVTVKSEDLDKYLGVYASTQMPLKVTITKKDAVLVAQATGQSAFEMQATAANQFKFDVAGVTMNFDPDKNQMTLLQGGGTYIFTKEKQ